MVGKESGKGDVLVATADDGSSNNDLDNHDPITHNTQ